jgi:hypothetical protein
MPRVGKPCGAFNSSKSPGAPRDHSAPRDKLLAGIVLHDDGVAAIEFVAVRGDEHQEAGGADAIAVNKLAHPAHVNVGEFDPVDDDGAGRQHVIHIEQPDDMTGHIADIRILSNVVFGVLREDVEGNVLPLLSKQGGGRNDAQSRSN